MAFLHERFHHYPEKLTGSAGVTVAVWHLRKSGFCAEFTAGGGVVTASGLGTAVADDEAIAPIVPTLPSSASVAKSSGIAVVCSDLAAVARGRSTKPAWVANALTKCNGVSRTFPYRRHVLPSIATTSPSGSK